MGSPGSLELKERWRGNGGLRVPLLLLGSLTPCSPLCTAGLDLPLTAEPLEARSTEAEESVRLVHTGTPIEARGWREEAVRGWVEVVCRSPVQLTAGQLVI